MAGSNLPTTKEVLCEHLHSKIKDSLNEDYPLETHHVNQVTGMLTDCSNEELLQLLKGSDILYHRVGESLKAIKRGKISEVDLAEKEKLGEELFNKISEIESELCAQITGMLMELDIEAMRELLADQSRLQSAVSKAKAEYLRELHPKSLPTRDEMGEVLHEYVAQIYPEEAEKITGMLLELDPLILQQLLDATEELDLKISQAKEVLEQVDGIYSE